MAPASTTTNPLAWFFSNSFLVLSSAYSTMLSSREKLRRDIPPTPGVVVQRTRQFVFSKRRRGRTRQQSEQQTELIYCAGCSMFLLLLLQHASWSCSLSQGTKYLPFRVGQSLRQCTFAATWHPRKGNFIKDVRTLLCPAGCSTVFRKSLLDTQPGSSTSP